MLSLGFKQFPQPFLAKRFWEHMQALIRFFTFYCRCWSGTVLTLRACPTELFIVQNLH